MGRFAPKHPEELRELIGHAIANGAKATIVHQQLADGRFPGWDKPAQVPVPTIRHYGQKERKKRAAKTVRPEANDSPKRAVDNLARLLLSAAMEGLEQARPGIDSDPKALKDWADALKGINALVSDTARTEDDKKPSKRRREPVPSDALSQKLLAKGTTTESATSHANGHDTTNQPTTPTPTELDQPSGGVAAQASDFEVPELVEPVGSPAAGNPATVGVSPANTGPFGTGAWHDQAND